MSAQVRASSGSTKEKASAPMPFGAATLIVSRLVQAIHIGGCGFCTGFGTTLRQGKEKVLALEAGVGLHHHHVGDLLGRLERHGALFLGRDVEAAELQPRRAFADAEVEPAARDDVERRQALGGARRMVVVGDHLADAVADADGSWSAPRRRRGTPPARRSASIPPGSGARPPRRSRSRAGRRARPAPAPGGTAAPRRPRSRVAAAGARRRSRSAFHPLCRYCYPPVGPMSRTGPGWQGRRADAADLSSAF